MKKVFSNSAQCIHVYAQQNQAEGRSSNVFFRDKILYSYGTHFPLCVIDTGKAILNSDSYSITTSKHQRETRLAVSHYAWLYADTEILKFIMYGINKYNKNSLARIIARKTLYALINAALAAAKRKKPSCIKSEIDKGINTYDSYVALLSHYKLKMPVKVTRLRIKLETNLNSVVETNKKAIAKAEKKRIKAAKERETFILVTAEKALSKWRNIEYLDTSEKNALYYLPFVALRANGTEIETTKGAEFPIDHARKAFAIIKAIKDKGDTWHTNGHTIHLGHFQIDSIDKEGNVKAGCHTVTYNEIESIAKQLNLI